MRVTFAFHFQRGAYIVVTFSSVKKMFKLHVTHEVVPLWHIPFNWLRLLYLYQLKITMKLQLRSHHFVNILLCKFFFNFSINCYSYKWCSSLNEGWFIKWSDLMLKASSTRFTLYYIKKKKALPYLESWKLWKFGSTHGFILKSNQHLVN